ncbi:MAG: AraC family transcriptional regulator [Chitinophagales bacterium]|nr:AraC family transcriptional regulator [Chitinophagales bacterium]
MIFETHIPAFPLNQFIESFIYYRDYNPAHSIDRLLPDGNITIIIDLTDHPRFIYDNNTLKEIQTCRHVWFSGIRNKPISIPSGRDSEMLIIQFHKGKSYPFISMPLHELADSVVDGELVLTNEILRLREKLLYILTPFQKFLFLEKQLLKIYRKNLVDNPFVNYAVSKIVHAPNSASIHQISDKVGYSQKHFIKIFREHVGLTPKDFLKVIRFQKAIYEIERYQKITWTNISYDCGYYDQSHFIADFKTFSGFTPNQYLKMRGNFTNYVAVG